MISLKFHTQNGNLQFRSYSLQEMSTLFREMSANQVYRVHSFFSFLLEMRIFEIFREHLFTSLGLSPAPSTAQARANESLPPLPFFLSQVGTK